MKTAHRSAGILLLGLSASAWLTGCAGSPPWGGWSKEPPQPQVQAALGQGGTSAYLSNYEVYRLRKTREKQYAYEKDGTWITSHQPPAGLPGSAVDSSPSVKLAGEGNPRVNHDAAKQEHLHRDVTGATFVAALP